MLATTLVSVDELVLELASTIVTVMAAPVLPLPLVGCIGHLAGKELAELVLRKNKLFL